MIINQKEIVLLPFPFSNLEGTRVRPALVVSNDELNKKSEDCIIVPLTTVIKEELYSVVINQEDLSSGRLLKSSRIRTDKIFSVKKDLVTMKIGVVNDDVLEKVKKEIQNMF
ncbi:MazF family transcriptional regulator [Candidatus Pacearchaeota archaeon]|nr:MazF family transcriptional regulator [Candidatus Pacearchaeota archaeon]|tara:strand:+ start:228 stop:563 length:336 start_codon:yes stop_codon:yes gene_type:complete